MPDAPLYRSRLVLLLGVLLLIAVAIAFRQPRGASPLDTREARGASPPVPQPIALTAANDSPISPTAGAEERPRPKKREGVDAANLYADAFVLFDRLTDEEKAMIRKPRDEVDAERAEQLFQKIQAILALLREAAKADYCDWGTGEINFETTMPHLGKAQDLAALALWAAGYRFATDSAGAIDDLSARARLGHHLTDTLLGVLVAGTFERTSNDLLRDRMSSLDAAAAGKALEFIASSTLDADLSRAFRGETSGVEFYGAKLARADAMERGRMLRELGSDGHPSDWLDPAKELVAGLIASPKRIAEEVAFIRGIHERAPDAMRKPEAEFQSWWRSVENEVQEQRPLVRLVLPAVGAVQGAIQRSRVERTLLTAGADVLQNGPAQLARYRDPATGGALHYIPTATGFELRSSYQAKGTPVTLSFSGRAP